jgi:hypothetical protein
MGIEGLKTQTEKNWDSIVNDFRMQLSLEPAEIRERNGFIRT